MVTARALVAARRDGGDTIAGLAREIGYSRSALSQFLSGTYPGGTAGIEAAIVRAFGKGQVACVADAGTLVSPAVCAAMRRAPAPISNPADFQAWATCQSCLGHDKGNES